MADVRTFCRICNALCGIVVTSESDTVTAVRGDPERPVSHGYTCSKGRSLPAMLHHPQRLEQPLRRGADGKLHPIGWGAVLDALATSIEETQGRRGRPMVAAYRGTHWALDCKSRAAAERFFRLLGTHQLYSSVTIDTPNWMLVPDLITGSPFVFLLPGWERSTLLLLVGQNPVVLHGHATVRPDAVCAVRRGGGHVVSDPRVTESARLADLHVRPRPGTDAALLAHLVRFVLDSRPDTAYLDRCADATSVQRLRAALEPYDGQATSDRTGVRVHELAALRELVARSDRLSRSTGTGVSMSAVPNATEWLAWALNAVTGSIAPPAARSSTPACSGRSTAGC